MEPRGAKSICCEECEEWKSVRPRLGCDAGGDLATFGDELRPMRQRALEECGAKGCPDKSLDDGWVFGLKGMEVGVRLPILEQQFDLPSKTIELSNAVGRERARQIGEQPSPRLLFGDIANAEP